MNSIFLSEAIQNASNIKYIISNMTKTKFFLIHSSFKSHFASQFCYEFKLLCVFIFMHYNVQCHFSHKDNFRISVRTAPAPTPLASTVRLNPLLKSGDASTGPLERMAFPCRTQSGIQLTTETWRSSEEGQSRVPYNIREIMAEPTIESCYL